MNAEAGDRELEVLERVREIPAGCVATYGDVSPGAPRFAGTVLCRDKDLQTWHTISLMPEIKLGRQGRIVIPTALRAELGLEEGDRLSARVEGGRLVLERPSAIFERLSREVREAAGDRDLVAELIAQRREEARREDDELERDRRRS